MSTQQLPTSEVAGVAKVVAAFRHAADLIERHSIPAPYITRGGDLHWSLYSWECPDGIPAMVAAIRRAVGGKWDKAESESYGGTPEMVFSREGYQITTRRDAVCVRRVVGTETVTVPARPALEAAPERIETREIVEWDCQPILADDAALLAEMGRA